MATPCRRRGPYRRYLRDATLPIPRQTLWRHRKQGIRASGSPPAVLSSPLPHPSHDSLSTPTSCATYTSPAGSLTLNQSPSSQIQSSPTLSSPSSPNHWSPESPNHSPPESPNHSSPESPNHSPPESPNHSSPESPNHSPPESPNHSSPESPNHSSPESPNHSFPESPPHADSSSCPLSDPALFEPLYPGTTVTLCGVICAIMQFCLRNKLSYTAIDDLLKLLLLICPVPNKLPTSFYKLKKFFEQFRSVNQHQIVCGTCHQVDCNCDSPQPPGHLVGLSIKKPLQTIISRHWNSLQSTSNRPHHQSVLRDVWDGSALRPLCAPGRFFSSPFNLALSLCTDGVEVFKSSRVCLWPVYVAILNLPAKIRMKAENMLLCGLWVGPGKPPASLLLAPIMKTIRSLGTLGLQIRGLGGLCTVRVKLVLGVFDLPAKAAVLHMKQFNGAYGCTVCEHPGTRLNRANVYLPGVYPDRTHAMVMTAAVEAERTNKPVLGVKGKSSLASTLDLVASIPVDYMHAVLEGVTKWLTHAWFNSANHRQPYYLGRSVAQIDKQLLQQRPPREFSRPPRSIVTHLKFWKASELRNWLLYYSLPILLNYLPPLYWHHYALLVCAMHILLKDHITHVSIDAAEQMLSDFHLLLAELYGPQSCTANAHLLLHLTKYVRLWGPLWNYSAFGFESKNGQLKYLFHGRSDIVHQVLFNIDVSYTLQLLRPQLMEHECDNCTGYIYQTNQRVNMTHIGQDLYIVGPSTLIVPSAEQCCALAVRPDDRIEIFSRLFMNGTMYYSTNYSRATCNKRDDTICCYREASTDSICFGRIEVFVASPKPFALLRKVHQLERTLLSRAAHPCRAQLVLYQQVDLLSSYIVPVSLPSLSSPLVSVPLDHCCLSKAVLVSVSDMCYVIVQPNSVEYH